MKNKVKGYNYVYNSKKMKMVRIKRVNVKAVVVCSIMLFSILVMGLQSFMLNDEIDREYSIVNIPKRDILIKPVLADEIVKIVKEDIKPEVVLDVKDKHMIRGVALNNDQLKVANQIIEIAEKENFKWIPYLLELSWCESRFDPNGININKNGAGKDRGIFQINDYWHKDISDKQAYDVVFSTKWTMNMINKLYQMRWMCDPIVRNNDIKIIIN